jgi:xylan 1,4-beta-xylosidase
MFLMTFIRRLVVIFSLLFAGGLFAQEPSNKITIEVKADQPLGDWRPIWNYFGYDEPNYTYAPNGKKLLGELAVSSSGPVYVRTHNLFTTGDGSSSLKWGSTNVYTEDASGKPAYDWRIVDQIFDTYHGLGMKPLVELGFMPEALSTHPEPYRHNFPNGSIFTGWAYPPKDYKKWDDLVFNFVSHLKERYGEAEIRTWLWEVWNEPDIEYWKGTQEEFFKLYDFAADATLRALPGAVIGGPDTTGPGSDRAAEFVKAFLDHCAHQKNFATGKNGAPLHFISFHPKGRPVLKDGHVRMGIRNHLAAIQRGFDIVASFPEWKNTPIILGESDPEGCAACSAQQHPENAYRNGSLYAAYTASVLNQIYTLEAQRGVHFQGAVTWAFEFEDQPYFAGFRELATNGLDKPVMNTFRMFGMLGGMRLQVSSTSAVSVDEMLKSGVTGNADVSAIATRQENEIDVLMWNYHDDDIPRASVPIALKISGVPSVDRVLMEHFRVDGNHSNAYAEWKRMDSPQSPSAEQYQRLEDAGQLQQLGSAHWVEATGGAVNINFPLPAQGLSLIRITPAPTRDHGHYPRGAKSKR